MPPKSLILNKLGGFLKQSVRLWTQTDAIANAAKSNQSQFHADSMASLTDSGKQIPVIPLVCFQQVADHVLGIGGDVIELWTVKFEPAFDDITECLRVAVTHEWR